MQNFARFSGCIKYAVLTLAVLGARTACAAPGVDAGLVPKVDCKQYEAQERANLAALQRSDPAIHATRLDSVFYSENRNACLASVYVIKGDSTYSGIFDIHAGEMLWSKSYRGTSFSPAHIVEMDEAMDEKAKELQSAPIADGDEHSFYFLADILDRTKNTLPAIKNALW